MKAVFRHEVSSYFTTVTGYVFGAFLLLFAGIYTMVYNLNYQVVNFEYVLADMSFVYLLVVPILTMRVLADEKRQKTDQLLYSLPLTMTKVVLGKYAAMVVMLLLPTLILCVYPLVLTAYGNVYLPAAYSAILSFFGLGAALLAIGMFISSITDSQAVAAGLCFVVMLLNYYLSSLSSFVSSSSVATLVVLSILVWLLAAILRMMTKSGFVSLMTGAILQLALAGTYLYDSTVFYGLFPEILEQLSLYERHYDVINGVFDVRGLVYYATVAGFFLYLSVQSMEKRRWSE